MPVAYLSWRIYRLGHNRCLIWTIIIVLLVGFRAFETNKQADRQTPKSCFAGDFTIYAAPDKWRIDGNLAMATVEIPANHQHVQLCLLLQHRWQQKYLKDCSNYEQIVVHGHMQPIMPATNRNNFDAQQYYAHQGIYRQLSGNIKQIQAVGPPGLVGILHCWRARIGHKLDNLPAPLNIYARRLLLGFADPGLQGVLSDANILGIIHLFCLSGLHVLVLCRLLKICLTYLHVSRERIISTQILFLPIFWILGGQATGLSRAVMMGELSLIGRRYPKLHVDAWSVSLLINLIICPGLLLSLGGQLTYLMSLTLSSISKRGIIFRSLALNLVSLPAILHTVFQFHILSLLANLILIPIFSWIIIPGVLLTCLLADILPPVVDAFNHFLLLLQSFLTTMAHFPGLVVFGKIPGLLALFLTALALVWVEQPRLNRKWGQYALLVYTACFIAIHWPLNGEVTFVDVGQGDCAIIRLPFNRQVFMIDIGGHLNFKQAAWQRRSAPTRAGLYSVTYLKSHGISKIDAILVSHHDADHCGYLSDVLNQIKVGAIILPSGMEKQKIAQQWRRKGQQIVAVSNKSRLSYPLAVIHPFKAGCGDNKDSMVLFGRFGGKNFMFMGDLDRHGERKILHHYPYLRCDVIKLGHHGSKTSSDPEFLKQLNPALAIISAGRKNRYGHPNPETINTLNKQNIPYLSTQEKGMITYMYWGNYGYLRTKFTGDELKWTLQR